MREAVVAAGSRLTQAIVQLETVTAEAGEMPHLILLVVVAL
jgi:hypothetical protein